MNIIVCIKQVPDTNDVKINPETGTLIREGVPCIINPYDRHAIEEALRLKGAFGGKVTVISMGPPQVIESLREIYAMGVDETILLSDKAFAGADTWATSYALGMAIKKIRDYKIVFCGEQAIDGDTAQVGPQLAEFLGIPQVTYVRRVEIKADEVTVERALENGHMKMAVPMPVLLTARKELNKPRYPGIGGIVRAFRKHQVKVWTNQDIAADPDKCGLKGSPTCVKKTFAPQARGKVKIIEADTAKEKVARLLDCLKDKVIGGNL